MNINRDSIFVELNLKGDQPIPDRVQLLPSGPIIIGRDGRSFVFEQSDKDRLIAAFNTDGAYKGPLPIDVNHANHMRGSYGEESPAYGWIVELTDEKESGIWGKVEWNSRGESAIKNKDYRGISPVFQRNSDGKIMYLIDAALTNTPNLVMKSINNRSVNSQFSDGETEEGNKTMDELNRLIEVLSIDLNGRSAKDAIVQEFKKSKLELQAKTDALEALVKEKNRMEINAVLDDAIKSGKVTPAQREAFEKLAALDLNHVKTVIASMPVLVEKSEHVKSSVNTQSPALTEAQKTWCSINKIDEKTFFEAYKEGLEIGGAK